MYNVLINNQKTKYYLPGYLYNNMYYEILALENDQKYFGQLQLLPVLYWSHYDYGYAMYI